MYADVGYCVNMAGLYVLACCFSSAREASVVIRSFRYHWLNDLLNKNEIVLILVKIFSLKSNVVPL